MPKSPSKTKTYGSPGRELTAGSMAKSVLEFSFFGEAPADFAGEMSPQELNE